MLSRSTKISRTELAGGDHESARAREASLVEGAEAPRLQPELRTWHLALQAAKARLLATSTILLALSAIDASQLPDGFYSAGLAYYPFVVGETFRHLVHLAWVSIAAQALLLLIDCFGATIPSSRGNAVLRLGVVLALVSHWAYLTSFSTLLLALVCVFAMFLVPTAAAPIFLRTKRFDRWIRRAAVLAVLAVLGAYYWNLTQYSARYLLASAILLNFIVFAGASAVKAALPADGGRFALQLALGAAAVTTCLPAFLPSTPAAERIQRAAKGLTSIGRAATRLDHRLVSAVSSRGPSTNSVSPLTAEARQEFLRLSGMPGLPSLARFNILLITADSTRFDKTSLANQDNQTTPRLLRFAQSNAFRFLNAYSPAGMTLQSIASLHTMSLPFAAGLDLWSAPWRGQLRPEAVTIAEILRDEGYHTWMISHNIRNAFKASQIGLSQGFTDTRYVTREEMAGHGGTPAQVDRRIADLGIEKLGQLANHSAPFFGWIFFESPHHTYLPHYEALPSDTDDQRYRQELRYMDEQLGRLLDQLNATGLLERTILVFMGDHGEELRDRGGIGHLTLYNECTHVPLLVRVPHVSGTNVDVATSTAFALPWLLLHASGAATRLAEQRVASLFLPILRATGGAMTTELLGPDIAMVAIVNRDGMKSVCNFSTRWCEAYNLLQDPGERSDLSLSGNVRPQIEQFEVYERVRRSSANYRFVAEDQKAGWRKWLRPSP